MVNRIPDDRSKSGALGNLMAVKGRKEHWWILEFLVPETLYDRVLTRTKLRCCHLCRWKKCKDLSCARVLDAPVTLTRTIKQTQNPPAGFCLISALIGIDNFYISNARFQSVMRRGMGFYGKCLCWHLLELWSTCVSESFEPDVIHNR